MEKYTCRVAKIVGTPTRGCWSQIHTFFPDEPTKKASRGIFLGVLFFSGTDEKGEAVNFGREILSRLQEEYYGELTTPAMTKLTQTITRVTQEFSSGSQTLEIVAGVILEKVLYLACSGSGEVWIKRSDQIQKVLKGNPETVETASGFLKENDFLVLGTASFFDLLPQGVWRAALENETPEEVVEILIPLVIGKEGSEKASALMVKFIQAEPSKIEEELPPSKKRIDLSRLKLIFADFWEKFPKIRLKEIYLRGQGEEVKRKKVVLTVALILIFLLAASVFFGTGKRGWQNKESRFENLYLETQKALDEGKALVSLNPAAARDLIFKAQELLAEAENLKIHPEKVSGLKEELASALNLVIKEHQLVEVPTLLNLALVRENGRGDSFSLVDDFLAILDTKNNRLFGVNVTKKSGEILSGGAMLSDSRFVTSYGDSFYVLTSTGVVKIDNQTKKTKTVIEKENIGENPKALKAFAGNLYLLDENSLWRFQATDESFGAKQKWFGEGVKPDLTQVVSLAIDGSVWFLEENGKILRFSQGSPMAFGVSGLDKSLISPKIIYTDFEASNLYLLDSGNKRVVVLDKGGEYQSQYLWEGMDQVTDLVVSERLKKIFLLAEEKILEIDLE